MGDLFGALKSGLARFVYAWLMPSIIASGVFVFVVIPQLSSRTTSASLGGAASFAVGVFGLSVVFAYASRPMYQFLEGHTMPRWVAKPLARRSRRRYARLRATQSRGTAQAAQNATEALKLFPDSAAALMPTRLGNALKAMESYGVDRYGLDSQTFWYELLAVADDKVRQSTEEARAAVDFFMSSVAHLLLLAVACAGSAAFAHDRTPVLAAAVAAALLAPCAYLQAVRNVLEWRYSVQALVNTSRPSLAASLSLTLPGTFGDERRMWESASGLVHHGAHDDYLRVLDARRMPSST